MAVLKLLNPLNGLILGCSLLTQAQATPLPFNPESLKLEGELGSFQSSLTSEEVEPGLWIATIDLVSEEAAQPPNFTLKWQVPSVDVHGFWTPTNSIDKVSYYKSRLTSRAANRAPVLSLYSLAGKNRLTFAASDALRTLNMGANLIEEDCEFHCYLEFFSEPESATKSYQAEIRFDLREVDYSKSLGEVANWWEQQEGYTPAEVPAAARMPMYSTWYAFHQVLDADTLVAECERAKPLGFDAIIIDDGWQTLDSQRGYAFTGDWKPERLTDMKGLSDRIHALDMKVLLWYSVPFVGKKAEIYEKFEGKYLRDWAGQGTSILDPRYPEVREYLIETYKNAVTDWDLDGLKLDFIGTFTPAKGADLTAEDGRDYGSVNEALDRLMSDVMTELKAIDPEIMIEFRQSYIGPLMRKYGNMFRAVDCPNMAVVNRSSTIELRLLSGTTAVHSDMYLFHPKETVENAAQQLLNILFSVPQLSVRLDTISAEHREMVAFWTGYWRANQGILLDGQLEARRPHENYPVVLAHGEEKTIAALYAENYLDLEELGSRQFDVVNATSNNTLVLKLPAMEDVTIVVHDSQGKEVSRTTQSVGGLASFEVPRSGLLSLSK